MDQINALLDRVKVVATAAVTYLTAAVVILSLVADQIVELLPNGDGQTVAAWLIRVVAVLSGAITIIRRVTPVVPQDRGLLPPDRAANANAPIPPNGEAGGVTITEVCLVVIAAVVVLWAFGAVPT